MQVFALDPSKVSQRLGFLPDFFGGARPAWIQDADAADPRSVFRNRDARRDDDRPESGTGAIAQSLNINYAFLGSTVYTRTMNAWRSSMYLRRNASVDSTVTLPSMVISPGLN